MAEPIDFRPATPTSLISLDITLPENHTEAEFFEAILQICKALNVAAGHYLVKGKMTTANPIMGAVLNGATSLEQAVLTARQMQQAASGLMVPGMGPRRMN